jgi:DNA-binding SARP family transcriptional activator/Tfp pilus assembly protein PilF
VRAGGHEVAITAARERALLAMLLLHANSPVTTDQLIEAIWTARPPRDARSQLQRCVHRLRRRLIEAGITGRVILTEPVGYRAVVAPADLDLLEFRRLVGEARLAAGAGQQDRATTSYREALRLWRGPALAGIDSQLVRQAGAALDEEHAQTLEERFGVALSAGGAGELVAELTDLLPQHPYREGLHRALMLALYRAGRQADALAAYRRLRELLQGDLGIEPGRELQELQRAILNRDPRLDAPRPPPSPPGPSPPTPPTPRELPADVAGFTGRELALKTLDTLVADGTTTGPVVIAAIAGAAGVGKTALAVHWAHQAAERFPDGQLFLDLRGYAAGQPLRHLEALAALLPSLGTPPQQVPADVDEAARLYRTLLADRRVLVVLDNAASADQVRPLLPGSPGCHVIVTSRDRLSGLVAHDGAHRLTLDVLPPEEAQALLATLLGQDRVNAEPDAATELARACAYLPLAIRITAAHLTDYPDRTIAGYVADLLDGDRLTALQTDGDEQNAVGAAFDLSYQHLAPESQRLFRMLALVPGRDFTPDAAAALAGIPPQHTRQLLHRLAGASLVDQRPQGRYAFHDLLRLYALRCSQREDGEPVRQAAVGRLLRFYLHTAEAAIVVLHPQIVRLPMPATETDPPAETEPPAVRFDDAASALAWLDAERANLAAAVRYAADQGPLSMAWLLTDRLRCYLWRSRHTVDWQTIADTARLAAEAEGDLAAQAASWLGLGNLHDAAGRYPAAVEHYLTALTLARRADWTDGQASVLNNLAGVHWSLGQLPHAAGRLAEALVEYRRTGNLAGQAGQATVLTNLGNVYHELGRLHQAAEHHAQGLALCRQLGLRGSEGISAGNLGEVLADLGRYQEAQTHLTQALDLLREHGSRSDEAGSLSVAAAIRGATGQLAEALHLAEAARNKAIEIGDRRAEAKALNTLGSVLVRLGRLPQAIDCHQQALEVIRQTGDSWPRNTALVGLAAAYHRDGDHEKASAPARQALELARSAGYRVLEGQALTILAEIRLRQGRYDEAAEYAEQAIDNHRETGHRPGESRTLVLLEHIRQARQGAYGE